MEGSHASQPSQETRATLVGPKRMTWVEEGDPGYPGVSQLCRPSLSYLSIPSICPYDLPMVPLHLAFCAYILAGNDGYHFC